MGKRLLAATWLLATPLAAAAQQGEKPVLTSREAPETVHAWISGFFRTDYIHRTSPITAFTDSFSNPLGAGNVTDPAAENTFEGEAAVRVLAEFANKVQAVLELGTRRADGDPNTGNGGINRFGDGEAIQLKLREARIVVPQFFTPNLRAEIGIPTWSFNPRGKGGSFAFEVRHSQTIIRNLDSDGFLNTRDEGFARLAEAAFVEEVMPMGAVLGWTEGAYTIDLVVLPAMIEGGATRDDESLYAIDLMMALDAMGKGSRAGLIIAVAGARTDDVGGAPGNGNGHSKIYIYGGGTSLKFPSGFEVYAEGYGESGQAGEFAGGGRIKAGGTAMQAGIEWHYLAGNPLPFWAGVNFTRISGDKTDPADVTNGRAGRFSAYEGVNDLLILEDPYYGYDWDANYQAIKISGGATFEVSGDKPDFEVMAIVGITRALNRVFFNNGQPTENKLGDEVDLKVNWHMTKQFSLKGAFAFLWGSTILEKAMGGSANPVSENHAWLFTLGWDLNF